MRVALATPVRPGSTSGNDVTAGRWSRRLTELGHFVVTLPVPPDEPSPWLADTSQTTDGVDDADLLVALHARRCAHVVAWWNDEHPDRPVVLGLTGTDLYRDLPDDANARASLQAATRLVVLQPKAIERLASFGPGLATKAMVIHQSAEPPLPTRSRGRGQRADQFRVAVLAHLREVKDPLLAARAARLLPATSRVRIDQAGKAHDDGWRQAALQEMDENPRYHWHGELARTDALALLAEADLLACTSLLEGGANVVTEAIALGVPVIGTRIDGNTGLLGDDYPALVPVGDADALAGLLDHLEQDDNALADLQTRIDARRPLTDPATERHAWSTLLATLPSPPSPRPPDASTPG